MTGKDITQKTSTTSCPITSAEIDKHDGLVYKVALKYLPGAERQGYQLEDLLQEGRIGLLRGLQEYDPEKGALSTIATRWINHYINRMTYRVTTKNGKSVRKFKDDNVLFSVEKSSDEEYSLLDSIPAQEDASVEIQDLIEKGLNLSEIEKNMLHCILESDSLVKVSENYANKYNCQKWNASHIKRRTIDKVTDTILNGKVHPKISPKKKSGLPKGVVANKAPNGSVRYQAYLKGKYLGTMGTVVGAEELIRQEEEAIATAA